MKNNLSPIFYNYLLIIFTSCIFLFTSCVSTKSTTYFNNAVDTTILTYLPKYNNQINTQDRLITADLSLKSLHQIDKQVTGNVIEGDSLSIDKNDKLLNNETFNNNHKISNHKILIADQGIKYNNLPRRIAYTSDYENIHIQKNDILSIFISSLNQEASSLFNTTNNFNFNASTSAGINTQASGYLVNNEGFIQLPIIGYLQVNGLTKSELKDKITDVLIEKQLLKDPIVNIRHINYEVTVIGEVGRPGVISVPNEKISFLKALGLAGDITIYGRKDKVLLIREVDGIKTVKYVNLNSKDFLSSPNYYLYPNDIIYVASNKNKVASVGNGTRLLPVFLSGFSFFILLIDRVIN